MTREILGFQLELPQAAPDAEPFTTARFGVRFDGDAIWPVAGAEAALLEVQIDDILSHLVEFWKPLSLRQTYPIAVFPDRPSQFRIEAEKRWSSLPIEVAEREDELVSDFEDAHDFSRCFAGDFELPQLWFLRAGDRMIVDAPAAGLRSLPFVAASKQISLLGDEIASHLAKRPSRWSKLIDAWRHRDQGDRSRLLAWSTGLDQSFAARLADEGVLSLPTSVSDAANDSDELRIAARMASALPHEQIRQILGVVRSFDKTSAPALDQLGEEVSVHLDREFAGLRDYEQGEAAARFVRERLSAATSSAFDIWKELNRLGVICRSRAVEPSSLDALAVWGDRYGPAVLLNESSVRIRCRRGAQIERNWAARVTLAHELCHLLLDRGHALSAVEVLNSKMPPGIERRAKSFAGELLLPYVAAAEAWTRAGRPRNLEGLEAIASALTKHFHVPKAVAVWKLEHGLLRQGIDLKTLLDAIAPNR